MASRPLQLQWALFHSVLLSLHPYVLDSGAVASPEPLTLRKSVTNLTCPPSTVIGKNQARLANPGDKDPGCCNAQCMAYCGLEMIGHWGFMYVQASMCIVLQL